MLCMPAIAALNHNPESVTALSKAYGFLLGQEYSLARIEKAYPAHRLHVEQARLGFGSAFPDAKAKLEKELAAALGTDKVRQLHAEMFKKVKSLLDQQALSPEIAQQFLEQVKARAKGQEIDPDVLNYLLAVRYADSPVGEFGAGFRQRYQTDGSGKSQGIKLKLQLPRSWVAKEGERPHIVQKWVSEGGTGMANILLQVRDAEGYKPSRREMDEFVRSGEIRDVVPDGARFITGGAFSQEQSVGYWMEMSMAQERAAMRMVSRGFMYVLFFRGKGVMLMCMTAGPEDSSVKVDADSVKMRPLCQQVMNSVVFEQAY